MHSRITGKIRCAHIPPPSAQRSAIQRNAAQPILRSKLFCLVFKADKGFENSLSGRFGRLGSYRKAKLPHFGARHWTDAYKFYVAGFQPGPAWLIQTANQS